MDIPMQELKPYLRQQVILTFTDDRPSQEGQLLALRDATAAEEGCVVMAWGEFPLSALSDIELADTIRDYHGYGGYGELLESGFRFTLADLTPGFDPAKIIYGDHTCRIACHLARPNNGPIVAKDLRLLQSVYFISPSLRQTDFLYFLTDGRRVKGHFEEEVLVTPQGDELGGVTAADIADVSVLAAPNDYVYLTLTDGRQLQGLVFKAEEDGLLLEEEFVPYAQVETLRFRGSASVQFRKGSGGEPIRVITLRPDSGVGVCACKQSYFRDPAQEGGIQDGQRMIFSAGPGIKGLIAKDAEVDASHIYHGIGFVIVFPNRGDRPYGYIGSEYITGSQAEKPRGNVSFTPEQMGDFFWERGRAYVARFTCNQAPTGKDATPAIEVEFSPDSYAVDEYTRLWVDEQGDIHAQKKDHSPSFLPHLDSCVGDFVELCTKDGTVAFGRLTECGDTAVVLTHEGERRSFVREELTQLRLYGQITRWMKAKYIGAITTDTGHDFFFHASSLRAGAGDERKLAVGIGASFTLTNAANPRHKTQASDICLCPSLSGWLWKYTPANEQAVILPNKYSPDEPLDSTPLLGITDRLKPYLLDWAPTEEGFCAVGYSLLLGGAQTYRMLRWVSRDRRRHLGFLYECGKNGSYCSGHVAPLSCWEDYLKGKAPSKKFYFYKELPLRSPITQEPVDPRAHSYWVSYTLESITSKKNHKNFFAAAELSIVAELASVPSTPPQSPALKLAAVSKRPVEEETLEDLRGALASHPAPDADQRWALGLIFLWGKRYTWIRRQYINSHADMDMPEDQDPLDGVKFYAEQNITVEMEGEPDPAQVYLVRYAAAETLSDQGERIVDARYPVQVLHVFPKGQYAFLSLADETQAVLTVRRFSTPSPVPEQLPETQIPLPREGETVLLSGDDGLEKVAIGGVLTREDEEGYSLLSDDGTERFLPMEALDQLFRFGLVVQFDGSTGVIADGTERGIRFSVDVMENRARNVVKAQGKSVGLQVLYTCSGNHVTNVRSLGEDVYRLLKWERGKVTDVSEPPRRQITISGQIEHSFSVLSNPKASRMFTNKELLDSPIYFRRVMAFTGDMAVEVCCREEVGKLEYIPAEDTVLFLTGDNQRYPLSGSLQWLRSLDKTREYAAELNVKEENAAILVAELKVPTGDAASVPMENGDDEAPAADEDPFTQALSQLWNVPVKELRNKLDRKRKALSLNPDSSDGEHAYYIWALLRSSSRADERDKLLRQLFLHDFGTTHEREQASSLRKLFDLPCSGEAKRFAAHLIGLDKRSAEQCCEELDPDSLLSKQLCQYVSDTLSLSVPIETARDAVTALQKAYSSLRIELGRALGHAFQSPELIQSTREALNRDSMDLYRKLLCPEDGERFDELQRVCKDLLNSGAQPLSQRISALDGVCRSLRKLRGGILSHPTRGAVELLLLNEGSTLEDNLLTRLLSLAEAQLVQLCSDETLRPQLTCQPVHTAVARGSKLLYLLLRNGSEASDLQTAACATLHLEGYTEQCRLTQTEFPLDGLESGKSRLVEVALSWDSQDVESFSFSWWVEYYCYEGANENGPVTEKVVEKPTDTELPVVSGIDSPDRKYPGEAAPADPYRAPAGPLDRGSTQFFGRREEKERILSAIREVRDGRPRLIPGSVVLLSGQKQCGKSSLINQVLDEIAGNQENEASGDPVLKKQAIVLEFPDMRSVYDDILTFLPEFYCEIIREFGDQAPEEVQQALAEHGIDLNADYFSMSNAEIVHRFRALFSTFRRVCGDRYCVILVMDEFTGLVASVAKRCKSEDPKNNADLVAELCRNLSFTKPFAQEYGFIQIIIGHDAMLRGFDSLGLSNHITEIASVKLKLTGLQPDEARLMIRKPMEDSLGYDVYKNGLGGQEAVDRLLYLSGRNPRLLSQLCSWMYQYYIDPKQCPPEQTWLARKDVDVVVSDCHTGDGFFDMLTSEEGDRDSGAAENRNTYQYLQTVALLTRDPVASRADEQSPHYRMVNCDKVLETLQKQYGPEAWPQDVFREIQGLLHSRDVIDIKGGFVKILAGLFVEIELLKGR